MSLPAMSAYGYRAARTDGTLEAGVVEATTREGARITPAEWAGSLVTEQADASGLLYRRNRYYDPASGRFTQPDPIGLAGGLNAYGFASGDPVNFSDPFGLCTPMPWCLLAVAGGGTVAMAPALPSAGAVAGGLGSALPVVGLGAVGGVMLQPAFPGDGVLMSRSTEGTFAAEATAVYNRREGKQIRAAIKTVTGQPATDAQYNCMSQYIHECKESGDGGKKNDKGDFTWDELVKIAKELFGKDP